LDSRIRVAPDRPEHLARELSGIPAGEVIGLGLGEAYQPAEQNYRVTRRILQVIGEQRRPTVVVTKSPTVCEDIPALSVIHQGAFAVVAITLVTLDSRISHHFEGQAPTPEDRLEAVSVLKQAGVPCGVALIPVLPYITDDEVSLSRMFDRIQIVEPDFVVWDSLWVHKGRHSGRIWQILSRLDDNLIERYMRLYRHDSQPSVHYRERIRRRLLDLCIDRELAPRIPKHVYADALPHETTAELDERNRQFMEQPV